MSSLSQGTLSREQAEKLLHKWDTSLGLDSIEPITPDASGRTYFRLFHAEGSSDLSSSVVMKFASLMPPEVGGREGERVLTDTAVVMLTRFFRSKGVLVPELYLDARDEGLLLIEDLGKELIGDAVLEERFTKSQIDIMYSLALEQLERIQAIDAVDDFFIFERSFTEEVFLSEMSEYSEYFLPQFSLSKEEGKLVQELFKSLAKELVSSPQSLCHRDYHAWNLVFDKKGAVRVIDFQDALVGPRAYDLASLLNDRDMDSALGAERSAMFVKSFADQIGAGGEFFDEYDRALLQRDLKVVGRFEKFAQAQGMDKYKKWVPGTSKRIFKSLKSICDSSDSLPVYREFLQMLEKRISRDELKA